MFSLLIPADEFRCCVMQMTKNFMQRHSLSLLFWQIFEKSLFFFQLFEMSDAFQSDLAVDVHHILDHNFVMNIFIGKLFSLKLTFDFINFLKTIFQNLSQKARNVKFSLPHWRLVSAKTNRNYTPDIGNETRNIKYTGSFISDFDQFF